MGQHVDTFTRTPDEAQGRILLDLLNREIDDITTRIETLEHVSAHAVVVDPDQGQLKRALIENLNELHRQIGNLTSRFPALHPTDTHDHTTEPSRHRTVVEQTQTCPTFPKDRGVFRCRTRSGERPLEPHRR